VGFGSAGPRTGKGPSGKGATRGKPRLGARASASCQGYLADVAGLGSILDGIADAGDAIIIGKTADGSAFAIRLLSDSGDERAYEGTQEGLDRVFANLAEAYLRKETSP